MKKLLFALALVLPVGQAIAGDSQFQGLQQASAEQQVLPATNVGWGQRAIGISSRPATETQEVRAPQAEEERGDSSYSPSSSDSDD